MSRVTLGPGRLPPGTSRPGGKWADSFKPFLLVLLVSEVLLIAGALVLWLAR